MNRVCRKPNICATILGMTGLSRASFDEAIDAFETSLARRPISDNTRKAFIGDARIFSREIQSGRQARLAPASITAERIKRFLASQERSTQAGSPKSIERRLTSLKVLFRWMRETGYIAVDPAESVAYRPFVDPLPEYLSDDQAAAVTRAARALADSEKLEHRPLTAIRLVLDTGIKKTECLNLTVQDIKRAAGQASIRIRYDKIHLRFKERELPVSAECLATLDGHISRYGSRDLIFDCTGRNLEYLFTGRVAPAAGVMALTFEMMRWTCALRLYRSRDYTEAQLQFRFGLSPLGWTEMAAKLARLMAYI